MNQKKVLLWLVIYMWLFLFLAGCGGFTITPIYAPTLTFTPPSVSTPPPIPKAGHWKGSSGQFAKSKSGVSKFVVTSEGNIRDFSIDIPLGNSIFPFCNLTEGRMSIKSDGTISIPDSITKPKEGENIKGDYIIGEFTSDVALTGVYRIEKCMQQIHVGGGTWNAQWISPILSIDKVAVFNQSESPVFGDDPVVGLNFSPDGKTLASIGRNGSAKLWDVTTGQELHNFNGVEGLAFSTSGKILTFEINTFFENNNNDVTIKLWDGKEQKISRTLEDLQYRIHRLAFSPDGNTIALTYLDLVGGMILYDLSTGISQIIFNDMGVNKVVFSPNGKILAIDSTKGLKLWDLSTRNEIFTLSEISERGWGQHLAFSSDGMTLMSARTSSKYVWISIWDVTNGKLINTSEMDLGDLGSSAEIAFSPDNRTVAVTTEADLIIADMLTSQEILSFNSTPRILGGVVFSPDGKTLASGNSLGEIYIWNITTAP